MVTHLITHCREQAATPHQQSTPSHTTCQKGGPCRHCTLTDGPQLTVSAPTPPKLCLGSLGASGSTLWDFPKENVNKHLFVPDRTPTADRRKFHLRVLVSMCVSGIHRSEAGATSRNGERTPTPAWVMTREIRNLGVPSSTCRHQEAPGCPAWVLALLEPGSRRLTSEITSQKLV